ncbi:type VI secretion system tip protein VgrG [Achromobacter sp. B7]|uniref:type VI secretion system Vgr family protein n=1 Tax=Achromobacter sp. B7 TaxID=2282475 RepID=UPI000E75A406|nr:type VI secretion system tip protein TssI/VgrG [Achromobacter sp. B7]AYD64767.1 type VI secretion system tip protein VgrG [Achromobacter sp. B7]
MAHSSDLRFTFVPAARGVAFDVIEFTLDEALSETYRLDLELSSFDPAIDFGALLDQTALFTLWRGDAPVRHVHGIVTAFEQGDTGFRRTRYRAVVEPSLARAALCSDWRIYQQLSVPEILADVFKRHGITDYEQVTTNHHLVREYCVQAGETDLDFVARLAAEEGYFHRYAHTENSHRLIHGDRIYIHGEIAGGPVLYNPTPGGDQHQPALHRFVYTEQLRTARQTQRDYTYTHPQYDQEHTHVAADLQHQDGRYERYDYPGRYKRDEAGKPFTQSRLLGLRRDARMAQVHGDDARLIPGVAFDLTGHPRDDWNHGWRPVRMRHHGIQHSSQEEDGAGAEQGTRYGYTADIVPDKVDWKPAPSRKPLVDGPQIASVVGPPNEEIYCDEFGRIKVQFPWDRLGQNNEHSSCWIRVSQNWAGAGWGHMAIPRIGQEVIVSFLDGDSSQPIVTGRTHRSINPPPYELPRHKTRMTIKSQTHKGEGYNELRFEDERDQEEIYVHAQKDQNIHVNHNETTFVGNDRSEQVEHDETITIGHDRSESVGSDEQVHIGQDRRHTIGQDDFLTIDRNHTIATGRDRTEDVGNNRRDKTVANHWIETGGHVEHKVQGHFQVHAGERIEGKTVTLELQAAQSVVIKGPGGTINIDDSGITLDAGALVFKGPINQQSGAASGPSMAGAATPGLAMDLLCALRADGTCPRVPCPCGMQGA